MPWEVILVGEVEDWFLTLDGKDAERVEAAINLLEDHGPTLGRPAVDRIEGSKYHNMKELRPGSCRLLFIFDPAQQAIILAAGDKAGQWQQWYVENIPLAESRYESWLNGYSTER